jgi:subtilisin family serine protease
MASTADFKEGVANVDALGPSEGLVFPDLNVAVVNTPPTEIQAFAATEESDILAIEPERIVYALQDAPLTVLPQPPSPPSAGGSPSLDYLRGYRDAVNHLCDKLLGPTADLLAEGLAPLVSESELTWGLQATKVPASRFTGKGIRVAVLDTGLDLAHPDFAGRRITSQSFVRGQAVQDGHGHGTHCIGTACGARRPGTLPRYGIAFEAEIFAGKVLSNQGSGGDAGILAGIQWAITNRCAVISMSLGAPVQVGQTFSQVFEQAAVRALAAGTLIIAAAGNESRRPQQISPVGHPANCPSIMAVGAIDRNFQIASFSCGGLNPQGGQVDIAGPGVDVRSSWPRPMLYNTISGTSMATPHVAGIAALWAQSNASFRARALMSILTQSARRLTLPARDVGAGLVQAP